MRRARIKAEGEAYYHVMSRCALQERLLTDNVKTMFMRMLRRAERFSGVRVLDYCIMDNHFHLLVKVPKRQTVPSEELDRRIVILYGEVKAKKIQARWKLLRDAGNDAVVDRERAAMCRRMYDISEFMKTFKQRFTLWYCSNCGGLEGTIWQGPFHSVLVEGSHDALTSISTYIALNPVRAGLVKDPGEYAWSGYGAACGGDDETRAALLSLITGKRPLSQKWNAYRLMIETAAANLAKIRQAETTRNEAGEKSPCPAKTPSKAADRAEPTAKAVGPAVRDRDVSRGVAFGSERFVGEAIANASRPGAIRTYPRKFCSSDGHVALYCAGRHRA